MRVPVPALLLPLFLAGCALPPAITVASLALSGASYATTGKSTTDHAISAVVGEDCALHRVVDEEGMCDPDGDVMFTRDATDAADANLYLDPEIGLTSSESLNNPDSSIILNADNTRKFQDGTDGSVAALSQAFAVERNEQERLANLIALAAEPTQRGRFANARPTPKPAAPQVQIQAVVEPPVQETQFRGPQFDDAAP